MNENKQYSEKMHSPEKYFEKIYEQKYLKNEKNVGSSKRILPDDINKEEDDYIYDEKQNTFTKIKKTL